MGKFMMRHGVVEASLLIMIIFSTVLYEMFAGDFPFASHHPETIVWLIGNGRREDLESLSCSVAVKSLIEDCWSDDPSYRPQFTEILNELNRTVSDFNETVDHVGNFHLLSLVISGSSP